MARESDGPESWHLDKKVPIAIIGTIIAQTLGLGIWAGATGARIDTLERAMMLSAPQAERIVRLETKLDSLKDSLTEIKTILRPVR